VIARHDFRPFGEELAPQTPPKDRKLFTGQERDFETGLDYFYARQLRVDLGRFTTPDPLTDLAWTDPTLGATNAYGYVNNNPLRYIDPTGMTPGLVHVNCTGVEACSQISSIWASANGYCVAADGGGLDCVRPSYIVQVTAPENSSVTQPLTPMGAGVLSFYPGRGPDDLPVGFQKDPPQTRIGPYVPPQPQRPTSMSNCMYSELVDSFFGDSDKTFLSVGLHVATAVALRGGKDAVAAFLPGPGWLYAAIALTYDAGKIAGAWVNCQGGQR
jgi:RHS repeat-associated protein